MTKKHWETPKLIVITRSRPEEAVLGNCKLQDGLGPYDYCMMPGSGRACQGASKS
jgi:hypothetical protein